MTRVLVVTASKHGATDEIGQAIADELAVGGIDAAAMPVADAPAIELYDAVVLGSAVYAGHWMPVAASFIERNRTVLRDRPVWLFSSGPVGDPPKPDEPPVDVTELAGGCRPVAHVVFAGRIDRKRLGFAEKAIVTALRVPEGDFRDWDAVRAWATEIADRLRAAG